MRPHAPHDPRCSPPPWSSSPRPPVLACLAAGATTRCTGFNGSWAPASHWAAPAVSCFEPPPRRRPDFRYCWLLPQPCSHSALGRFQQPSVSGSRGEQPPASSVLSGMRMHRQNGLSGPLAGRRAPRRTSRPGASAGGHAAARVAGTRRTPGQTPPVARLRRGRPCPARPARETPPRETPASETLPANPAPRDSPAGPRHGIPPPRPRPRDPPRETPPGETVAVRHAAGDRDSHRGLDSPELEAWAADVLTPCDADGLVTSWSACTWSLGCC